MNDRLALSVVDCESMKVRTVKDFWKSTSDVNSMQTEPVAVIASKDGSKIVGVSEGKVG